MKTQYAILVFLLLLIPICEASTGSLNFSVSPSIIDIKVRSNSTTSAKLAFVNNNTQDLTLSVSVQDLAANPNGSTSLAPANTSNFSCAPWITPDKNEFMVKAGAKTTLAIDFKIPGDVQGGRYAVILFEPIASKEKGDVKISGRIGVLVMLSIAGPRQLSAEILDFHSSTKKEGVFLQGQIKNTGTIHYKCRADIVIISHEQRIVDRLNVNWASQTILPNTTRGINVVWNNPAKMKPGKYNATLRFFIHGGGKTLQQKIPILIK